MTKTVIIAGARTPFGKLGGALSSFTASELGVKQLAQHSKEQGLQKIKLTK